MTEEEKEFLMKTQQELMLGACEMYNVTKTLILLIQLHLDLKQIENNKCETK